MSKRDHEAGGMARNFFNLIVVLIMIAASAFLAAPWFAFRALKADARDGDAQGLAELIDYNAVRASLKAQLTDQPAPATPPPSVWTDPLGALRQAIQPLTPPPPAVERYVSVEGLHALTRGYAPGKAPAEPPPPATFKAHLEAALHQNWPRTQFWDPNRTRLAVKDPNAPERETVFTFERKGWFSWKLVNIKLPAKAAGR
jgi:hypothetical protein